MTIKEEIQIEEYKRTFAEAYKQGFIDAMSVCKPEPQIEHGFSAKAMCSTKLFEDEPQKWETPPKFEHKGDVTTCVNVPVFLIKDALIEDEPQTAQKIAEFQKMCDIGCSRCESRYDCYDREMPHAVRCNNYGKITDELQTDCGWK